MEFEEVEMEEDYLIEGDISDASPVKTSHEPAPKVARLVPKSEPSTSGRKIPIIRSAGAVVTPVRTAIRKPVQVSAVKIPVPSGRKPEVQHPVKDGKPSKQSYQKANTDSSEEPSASNSNNAKRLNDRLAALEDKLDLILEKLDRQEKANQTFRYELKGIRQELGILTKASEEADAELQSSVEILYEPEVDNVEDLERSPQNLELQDTNSNASEPGDSLLIFPIPSQEYFERLEEILETDESMRQELFDLFDGAPKSDVYTFLRKNLDMLFSNINKYTWTGKAARNTDLIIMDVPAPTLISMRILLECAVANFGKRKRPLIEKECRKALARFNEARMHKMKRQELAGRSQDDDDVDE
ncbi:uncharacterized protein LOC129745632 isoform X1 [Uranotaenia lowii]|uniref:uncharacterized protein LOC129745632 isoform X1 n=1 Tax=Uranotaenia lowii TaxID=190385 RepID=UPI0024790D70|nr:uncharacterized protein LOC129745632 isoform X1 [Uranotaenia lowii]